MEQNENMQSQIQQKQTPKEEEKVHQSRTMHTNNREGLPHDQLKQTRDTEHPDQSNAQQHQYAFQINSPQTIQKKRSHYPPLAYNFKPNSIKTTQYTIITFLPKNLLQQFTKITNLYFLLIMVLQVIPAITITKGEPAILFPLLFVMAISGIKDALEDLKRHQSDRLENGRKCQALGENGQFQYIEWKEVKVGMILKIVKNELFPADLLLLSSSDTKGICYIETKNIDGETNLKHKQSIKLVSQLLKQEGGAADFHGFVSCDLPNDLIYTFNGSLTFTHPFHKETLAKLPLTYDTFLLRGASLKSTEHIYGAVLYTGHDTKLMRNTSKFRIKVSKLERMLSRQVILLFVVEIILCTFACIYGTLWEKANAILTKQYLQLNSEYYSSKENWVKDALGKFATWILIFTNFIPISMQATLESVKMCQGTFMQWDWEMYDEEKDMPAIVQSSNLNEELGQISYIFSDKTGTLTQNMMEFKKFSVSAYSYGKSGSNYKEHMLKRFPNLQVADLKNINFEDPKYFKHFEDPEHENYHNIREFLEFLALCHTIIIEEKGGTKIYNSSSPDELALVNGAKYLGYGFQERDDDNNILVNIGGEIQSFQLLHVIEFSSDRKRMSVIIKDQQNRIRILCKGADCVIQDRLAKTEQNSDMLKITSDFIREYAKEGLRTLFLAQRIVEQSEFDEWQKSYQEIMFQNKNKEELINLENEKIEKDLILIGSTAIEDKLQEEVSETIAAIKEADIKVWVLTGDKIETAINIGYSCALLDNTIAQTVIDSTTLKDLLAQMGEAQKQQTMCLVSKQEQAIIVSGESLTLIMSDEDYIDRFMEATDKADVIMACRVSPKQKADIVQMVRQRKPKAICLAIGDGANDVNMINQANVGVGISGLEGQQAARSADYAIGQFKFIRQILFVHGREAYRKNSHLICYIFYKNILFVMPQFIYGFLNVFSGSIDYEQWLYLMYNIVFTAAPIIWYAVFDAQYCKEDLFKQPKYYMIGPRNTCFSRKIFWLWIVKGTVQGGILLFLILYSLEVKSLNANGDNSSFWVSGCILYFGVVVLCNMQLIMQSNIHMLQSFGIQLASIMSFLLIYFIENRFPTVPDLYGTFLYLWTTPQYYFITLYEVLIVILYEKTAHYFQTVSNKFLFKNRKRRPSLTNFQIKKNSIIPDLLQSNEGLIMEHHGFAFSQVPGEAPLIVQNLERAYIKYHSIQRSPVSSQHDIEYIHMDAHLSGEALYIHDEKHAKSDSDRANLIQKLRVRRSATIRDQKRSSSGVGLFCATAKEKKSQRDLANNSFNLGKHKEGWIDENANRDNKDTKTGIQLEENETKQVELFGNSEEEVSSERLDPLFKKVSNEMLMQCSPETGTNKHQNAQKRQSKVQQLNQSSSDYNGDLEQRREMLFQKVE